MELGQSASEIELNTQVAAHPRDLTPAPPAEWHRLDSGSHSVQLYEDDAALLKGLSRFIGSALGAGGAAVVIATKAHRDEIDRLLRARGQDIARATSRGRYVPLDAAETLSKVLTAGWPDTARLTMVLGDIFERAAAAASPGHPHVAVFAEMVALLREQGRHEAAIRLEQIWNELYQTYSLQIHCAHPMASFREADDAEMLERICAEHGRVIPAESYTSLTTAGERLRTIALLQQRAQALETEIERHKRAQAALQRREAELQEALVARDEFLAVAAHELKTPITSLRAFAQLLLRDARHDREIAPERLESALKVIELQTGKLTGLVRRLLDSAQIGAGKLRIKPVSTDLVALVHSALAQYQNSEGYTVNFDGPECLEAVVDPVRFEQVVTNLVDNAVKFSLEGGVVTVKLNQTRNGSVRLSVTDRGIGIPPDQRERVFERFRQARIEDHRSGLGLSLYVIREIIEAHGGSVRVEAPEHRGSRFVVVLPPSAGGAQAQPAA